MFWSRAEMETDYLWTTLPALVQRNDGRGWGREGGRVKIPEVIIRRKSHVELLLVDDHVGI